MRRIIIYNTAEQKPGDKTLEKNRLEKDFEGQIRTILSKEDRVTQPEESALYSVIRSVREQLPTRVGSIRSYMQSLIKELDGLYPGEAIGKEDYDDSLVKSLDQTKAIVASFGKLIEEVAILNDDVSLKQILSNFTLLLIKFYKPIGFIGRYDKRDEDFYRFLGNELFVTMISVLMREQKWPLIKSALETNFILPNAYGIKRDVVSFQYLSKIYLLSFEIRNKRLSLRRISAHADILKDRHSNSPIKEVSEMEDYLAADYLLFLKGESANPNNTDVSFEWAPLSLIYLNEVPRFILEAQSKKIAKEIIGALELPDISTLSVLIINKSPRIKQFWSASGSLLGPRIDREQAEKIGTTP